MPRKPNATRPNAKIGAANGKAAGIIAATGDPEKPDRPTLIAMSANIARPVQNAEKLPATKPERTFSEAPPCSEQVTTSLTCWLFVLVKILVNSGMSAPARVPHDTIDESTHHR